MSRKRDPNKPIKQRTRLETVEDINRELRRTYRLFINKQITHAEMSRRRELLVALRAGLPEPVERPKVCRRLCPASHSDPFGTERLFFEPGANRNHEGRRAIRRHRPMHADAVAARREFAGF